MTDFLPGDRVLVTADCLPEGGMLATVTDNLTLRLDGLCDHSTRDWSRFHHSDPAYNHAATLHHRPRPPRPPDPEPFTRSDGFSVEWIQPAAPGEDPVGWIAAGTAVFTVSDARRLASGFERVAAVLEWEAGV